jgi:hypothetical protein
MGWHRELVARRRGPVKRTKLTVVVDDVGQAPKVQDLARSEGTDCDKELAKEADTAVWGSAACSGDEAGGSGHRRA